MAKYSYIEDTGIIITERYERFEELIAELEQGLEAQGSKEVLSSEDIREDSLLAVPDNMHHDGVLDNVTKYSLGNEDNKAVYIFDHPSGKLLLGDEPMMAVAMPDYVPECLYTGLGEELSQSQWKPDQI